MNFTGSWSIIKNENKCPPIYLQATAQLCNNRRGKKPYHTYTCENKCMCDFNTSFSSYLFSFLIYKNMNLILWWCTAPNVDQWEFITFPAKQSINSTFFSSLVTSSFPLTLSTIWLFNLMPGNFLKGMLFLFH